MSCINLRQGQDSSCNTYARKYYQQVVLVNKSDVKNVLIVTPSTDFDDEFTCRYRISFQLYEGKTGYRFTSTDKGNNVFAMFSKSVKEGFPQYKHTVQLPIFGVDEKTKCVIDQLDFAEYFAAVQYQDGTVEIYGYEFGLKTEDYEYNPANNNGGSLINLSSDEDGLEDEKPFIYISGIDGNESIDFDNNFSENPDLPTGDFNDDFNNDFYIQ